MELILSVILNYLVNLAANERSDAIHKQFEEELTEVLAKREKKHEALASGRSLRNEIRSVCIKLASKYDHHSITPIERSLWHLLSDEIFQNNVTDWLMAGVIEEGKEVKNRLLTTMETALTKSGASEEQITFLKTGYFESLDKAICAHPFLAHWRHQLSLDYLREQVAVLRQYAEESAGVYSPATKKAALDRYCDKALATWDIIDLSNLPEGDIQMATQKFLLRQLYMPLRVKMESRNNTENNGDFLDKLEEQRDTLRHREAGHLFLDEDDELNHPKSPSAFGEGLSSSQRLVVLGDPGGGKTTMLRWMATAYLLRHNDVNAFNQIPDTQTLPNRDWIPVLIRCRDLGEADLCRCFSDFLTQHLYKTELLPDEAVVMRAVILEYIARGEALLLVDGLDEITNPQVRITFCQELERTATRYPNAPIVVTSRIVGYRDMPYRMGSGFMHGVIAELNREDKDLFAKRWIEVTEQHQSTNEKTKRVQELIEALHSNNRIERFTSNPMLLTTLALVKRKVGKLPNRRNKLYSEAVSVLLNWNPMFYRTIEEDEALPQLEYLAYEMCRRGVQRLTNEEVLDLLERLRVDYPNVRAIRHREPQAFLELLEARSSILIKSGGIWQTNTSQERHVWEFRHLTFQEYLASRALLDGRYPDRGKTKSLARQVAPLAGAVEVSKRLRRYPEMESEVEVPESWREVLRLLVVDCKDDDVDDVLLAILNPLPGEDKEETGRPRAGLAAFCIVDEPNVSEAVVRQVFTEFAKNVNKRDGAGTENTLFDSAALELSGSMWAPLLRNHLVAEYCKRAPELRKSVGYILGTTEMKRLEKIGPDLQTCFTELVQCLQTGDRKEILSTALTVMATAHKQKAVIIPGLIEALFGMLHKGPVECHAATWALLWLNYGYIREEDRLPVWMPNKKEFDLLIKYLNQTPLEEEDIRSHLRTIIANVGYDKGAEVPTSELVMNLNSNDADVRKAVVTALGRLGDVSVVKLLMSRLNDSDAQVRHAVVVALGKLGDSQTIDTLIALLRSEDAQMQRVLAQALGNIKDPRAVEPLIALLRNEDTELQRFAAQALGKIKDPRAVKPLIALIKNGDVGVQRAVILALGKIKDPRAVKPLIALIKDGDDSIRYFAGRALLNIKHPCIVEPLIELLKDDNIGVQNTAVSVLNSYALDIFLKGDVDNAAVLFKLLSQINVDSDLKNNLLYCYIVLKQYEKATDLQISMECSKENYQSPFIQHNLGILTFITGQVETAKAFLWHALKSSREPNPPRALCMLLLDGRGHSTSEIGLPFEAACLLNLYRVGAMSLDEVTEQLCKHYPDGYLDLIAKVER